MTKLHEVVIVGSGIMGSCTAYHSARAKLSPLVLEQFEKGHHKGSSHGKSRIIRYSHGYPTYLPIMTESYRLWDELAKESRERLVNKCGLLRISDEKTARANAKILIDGGLSNRILTGRQIREEFPQFHYDDSWFGMLDPEGGIIYADKCLEAAQEQATKQGAVFKFGEKVTDIKSESDHVVVVTNKDTYSTKSLVVTAGGWLSKVLPEMDNLVHTQAEQIGTYYWNVKSNPDRYDADKQCPTIVIETKDSKMFMVPPVDYPGQIKLCIDACEAIDPNNPLTEMPQWMEDYLKEHIAKHLPDIDASAASKIDMCIYTMTKDHHYAIGRLPSDPRILVGGGFSGTGLKLAISVGRMLTDLVRGADERTTIPELFSLTRKRVRGN